MGGIGSGGGPSNKGLTQDQHSIDVRRLRRDGLLKPRQSFLWQWTRDGETLALVLIDTEADRLTLSYPYRVGDDWRPMRYPVELDRTPCSYGGTRPWFLCPSCGRRIAVLYLDRSGLFACRHCCRLVYAVERETDHDKAFRRAETIRRRLGWQPGIANPPGSKPKRMHWRTFEWLVAKHDRAAGEALAITAQWLNRRIGAIRP